MVLFFMQAWLTYSAISTNMDTRICDVSAGHDSWMNKVCRVFQSCYFACDKKILCLGLYVILGRLFAYLVWYKIRYLLNRYRKKYGIRSKIIIWLLSHQFSSFHFGKAQINKLNLRNKMPSHDTWNNVPLPVLYKASSSSSLFAPILVQLLDPYTSPFSLTPLHCTFIFNSQVFLFLWFASPLARTVWSVMHTFHHKIFKGWWWWRYGKGKKLKGRFR